LISSFVILYNAVYVIEHARYKSNNTHSKLRIATNHQTTTALALWKHFPGLQIKHTRENKSEAVDANSSYEFKDHVHVWDHAGPENADAVVDYCR